MSAEGFNTEGQYDPNGLFNGDFPVVSRKITVVSGQNLAAGAVVGKITASGKYALSDDGAVDGSQTPVAVLAEAVDASAADAEGLIHLSGEFNPDKLVFGGAHTAASTRDGLRDKSIYI